MKTRVITALIAAAVLIAILILRTWVGSVPLYCAIILLYIISLNEMLATLRSKGFTPSRWAIYLTGLIIMPAYLWRGPSGMLLMYCLGVVLAMCSAIFMRDPREGDMVATAFPLVYPTLPFLALFMIAAMPEPYGPPLFLTVLLSSIASDIFAFVAGSLFGRHKLIPSVSPNKTWEGAVGGLIMTIAVMAVYGLIAREFFGSDVWLWHFIFMGAIGSVATQLGDLVASSVKRYCGVKDFGNFFPGHGGVLDRLDGMLFNAVFLYLYAMLAIGGIA